MARSATASRSRNDSVESNAIGLNHKSVESATSFTQPSPPAMVADSQSTMSNVEMSDNLPQVTRKPVGVVLETPLGFDRGAYAIVEGENTVQKVLRETVEEEGLFYKVRFGDTHTEVISFDRLLLLENGEASLQRLEQGLNSDSEASSSPRKYGSDAEMVQTRKTRVAAAQQPGFTDFSAIQLDSDEDQDDSEPSTQRSHPVRGTRARLLGRQAKQDFRDEGSSEPSSRESSVDSRTRRSTRRITHKQNNKQSRLSFALHTTHQTRSTRFADDSEKDEDEEEDKPSSDDDFRLLRSDVLPRGTKRRKLLHRAPLNNRRVPYSNPAKSPTRRSERATRHQINMEEIGVDDIYRGDSSGPDIAPAPKASGAREAFKALPRGNKFRERHYQVCDTCKNSNNSAGQLVYCQGCTLAYHRTCLGPRGNREHLVTKVGEDDFVLQCRRCVNVPQKKDIFAPNLARCQDCNEIGISCVPFRTRRTAMQEQKEREENDGEDPIANISPNLINNPNNVLFRCTTCSRGFHFHHLESRNQYTNLEQDEEDRADSRFSEYSRDWLCKDCAEMPAKVGGLIAWRPADANNYNPALDVSNIEEDEKEYLIKWDNLSYFRAQWMRGAWTWGVVTPAMRKAFFNKFPTAHMRTEDAIPEEWLRIDIVLDVKYTNRVDFRGYDIDKARIKEVDKALLKYKGLGYEDAVWETVPAPEDGDRWTDFVVAYNDWVLGRYTTLPSVSHLKTRVEKTRSQKFKEKTKQPENLEGGELMKYQLDGLNWLYYQWYQQKNGILADEMGLGKTIQIIAFFAMMVQDIKCFPFLVVVPNATCPNWRREIKQWAPKLRAVTYFGSAKARQMAYEHELFPDGSKSLHCHVVITSYEAVTDETSRRLLRGVTWQGLVVDEGQRLKNDRSILHNALRSLKVPFRILLTGTPLQNNARELFNLLQFLDDSINAAAMEEEYAEMTNEKITRLHTLIRPFILRRTKLQVLGFLPPMAQIIVPVSMSVLQKKTYKSILEKKPDLLRSLFSTTGLKSSERVGLNNILMQLRKCLCHPFVFSQAIEERHLDGQVTHKNLVEASSKLQLLELLLPKLQERGHRVLIFSQFLDMLDIIEDFIQGMGLQYQRLDGKVNALEKQKRIDEFNAPASPLFAFLLSTRAGGVGINLATADTVIILDPDYNPHQDIQAISRAHRIGQTKKVLCFQLMTRGSAEERIMQMGRKKIALDEVVINNMDEEDVEEKDMESILKHGMVELFKDDDSEQVVRYDAASVEKLLDRTHIENTKAGNDSTAESQFSFARVWANDSSALQESLEISEEEQAPDPSFWEKILKDREKQAAARAADEELGRGRRQRRTVDYNATGRTPPGEGGEAGDVEGVDALDLVLITPEKPKRGRKRRSEESDTDFQASESEAESEEDGEAVTPKELGEDPQRNSTSAILSQVQPQPHVHVAKKPKKSFNQFKRVNVEPPRVSPADPNARMPNGKPYPKIKHCLVCSHKHAIGSCPIKLAGIERCNICGMAHYGHARVCPHLKSETMVRTMLEALKISTEPKDLIDAAVKYLRGVKGHLVQEKKKIREKASGDNGQSKAYMNGFYMNEITTVNEPGKESERPGIPWNDLPVEERLRILTDHERKRADGTLFA